MVGWGGGYICLSLTCGCLLYEYSCQSVQRSMCKGGVPSNKGNQSVVSTTTLNIQELSFFARIVPDLNCGQHASVSQGRICSDKFTCCHTEIEFADHTFHLTQSKYTDTGPTCQSTDLITPGAWQSSKLSANF